MDGRLPPQAIEIEQSVLSACLLYPDSIVAVEDYLRVDDFYRNGHGLIYGAMLELSKHKKPVDISMVVSQLRDDGNLETVGGATYVATLMETPVSLKIEKSAKILREKAVLRKTIEICHTTSLACFENGDPLKVIDKAQGEINNLDIDGGENVEKARDLLEQAMERHEAAYNRKGKLTGYPTGFSYLDYMLCGWQKTDLIIIAARPSMGKTSLAMSFDFRVPTAFFSLEMSKQQLIDKLLAKTGKVNGQKFRSGQFSKEDWGKITDASGEIYGLPLYIDDSSALHYLEIRRRTRKYVKKYGVRQIIVDHLQLMRGDSTQNRNLEISSITAGLKALAKDLKIPVILLSQLNRKVEERGNKHPVLSDLRDSGCLGGSTKIFSHNHNSFKTMGTLDTVSNFMVDSNEKIKGSIVTTAKKCFATGEKQLYGMELISGHKIEATGNHKFLTPSRSWARLDELSIGSMVGLPLNFGCACKNAMPDSEIKMLALFLGNGCCLQRRSLQYTSHSDDVGICNEIKKISNEICKNELRPYSKLQVYRRGTAGESTAVNVFFPAIRKVSRKYRNPLVMFFEKYGMYGKRHSTKEIPGILFNQSMAKRRLFIKYLWATDGTISVPETGKNRVILAYSSSSVDLINQLQFLLQSVGILSSITKTVKQRKYVTYLLWVRSRYFIDKFLNEIGIAGSRKGAIINIGKSKIKRIDPGWTKYELDGDIVYVPVKNITKKGVAETYDIEVPGTHNFFANGFIAHNSIEQDADVVMFLYRDEVYNDNPNNPSKGIAEINIAKQRNGPTGVVKAAWLKEYATFENLAKGE